MVMSYQVIVGNIGTVYDGPELKKAIASFKRYMELSTIGGGRGGHEPVTLMKDGEIRKEFHPKLLTPSIKELASLIMHLKKGIGDDYRATDDPSDDVPGMCLTIGCSYDKSWSYQTGDNSYSGGAYGHPFWGVGYIYRNSNSVELAREIINDVHDQTY